MFEDAALVFGPHGGAYSNLIFAPKGCNVMEMGPHYYFRSIQQQTLAPGVNGRWVFYGISSSMDMRHFYVEPKGLPPIEKPVEQCGGFKEKPKFLPDSYYYSKDCGTKDLNVMLNKVGKTPGKQRGQLLSEVLRVRKRCARECLTALDCFPWDDHNGFSFEVDVVRATPGVLLAT